MISIGIAPVSSNVISSAGSINYSPRISINVNTSKALGQNNLSLGFMLDWERWSTFTQNSVQKQLAKDARFKLIRVFDFRPTAPRLMPCISWNESAKTGTFNWTNIDRLTREIFDLGAEPLFCLGYARPNIVGYIPSGMAVDPTTELPYPESYAAYAAEWVKHFKQISYPVRFYQIMNEPFAYFGWSPSDTTKLAHYAELWNASATAMRKQNPNILLSQDAITQKSVLDYWITHSIRIDFLDFHKYDASTVGQYTDAEMFNLAERRYFETSPTIYGINEARQRWFNAFGKWLPAINSESNFNSAWENGTDPKIQQMTGAVWLALILKTGILKGLDFNVYFEFTSSKSSQEAKGTGWGFGMINKDDNRPWYPYYVQKLLGSNLTVGDPIVEIESSSDEIRGIAWIHEGGLNMLLICKVDQPRTIILKGISGLVNASWIDNTISYQTPSVQVGSFDASQEFTMNGYTVMLLEFLI